MKERDDLVRANEQMEKNEGERLDQIEMALTF